jgi:hypothetical protein
VVDEDDYHLYHVRNLTLTLNCVGKTDKTLLAYLFTVMHGPLEKRPCLETVPGTVFTFGPRTVREHHIR